MTKPTEQSYYYKGWKITYNPKPIGNRCHDWEAVHPDYDGADGGNGLHVTAGSVEDCRKAIDEVTDMDYL